MSAPVKNTCPDIDKYIKWIKNVTLKSKGIQRMDEDHIREACEAMNNELNECIGYLEDLRQSNDALRKWGTDLENQLENAATEINELEEKLLTQTTK